MMRNKNRLLQRQHDVLRLGANAELATPDANAAGDVEASVALCERTISALVDGILNPGDGPHLSVVRVTTKLEVDASSRRAFQVVRLVVEENFKAP